MRGAEKLAAFSADSRSVMEAGGPRKDRSYRRVLQGFPATDSCLQIELAVWDPPWHVGWLFFSFQVKVKLVHFSCK